MEESGEPQSPLDVLLVDLCVRVLGAPVGMREALAARGATARQVEMLTASVERELGVAVATHEWTPPGTLEALAAVLVREGVSARGQRRGPAAAPGARGGRSRVLARNTGGTRVPLIFLHGDFNGAGFYCLSLAVQLGPAQPFLGLMPHGLDGVPIPASVEEMAEDHLATLRTLQPAGPYRLGGHCNGGLIAFEMARRLEMRGEQVSLVILVASDVRSTARPDPPPAFPARVLHQGHRYGQYYWRRLRAAVKARTAAPRPPADAASRGARAVAERRRAHAERREAYGRVLSAYTPGPYRGRVVLLWPEGEPARHPGDSTQGWSDVAAALEVRSIPGGHLSCVTTHVRALATQMRDALER
jgi:thioesterase domain-containing protein